MHLNAFTDRTMITISEQIIQRKFIGTTDENTVETAAENEFYDKYLSKHGDSLGIHHFYCRC